MKSCSTKTWLVVFTMMTVGSWTTASNGAEQPAREPNPNDLNLVPTQNVQAQPVYQQMQQLRGQADAKEKTLFSKRPLTGLSGNIRTAAEAVRDAKGDEAKAAAQKTLSDLLGKYFDEDMARRQQELTQIEERLTKLRELLERRRTKKQDILELQMRVALNEADGLGFYDDAQSGRGKGPGDSFFYDHAPTKVGAPGTPTISAPTVTFGSEPAPEPAKSGKPR